MGSDEFGISGCCYDSRNEMAYITTNMSQGAPFLLYRPSSGRPPCNLKNFNGKIHDRIQCATLCPTGDHLLLINNENDEVFLGHAGSDTFRVTQKDTGKLKRANTRNRDQMMTAAMTSCENFCLFWIEGGKGTLVSFVGGEKQDVLKLD